MHCFFPTGPAVGRGSIQRRESSIESAASQTCKPSSSPLPVVGRQDRTQEEGSHSLGDGRKGSTAEGKQPPKPASSPVWPVPAAKQSCGLRATGR